MEFVYSDGGRSKYFSAENVGDCVCRAIANATGKDYKEVYDGINELAKKERTGKRKRGVSNARNGVYKYTWKKYIEEVLGWEWVPCMQIGSGCQVHLKSDELPSGNLIINLSKHHTCVKDGVLYDTYDCSRDGTRCVYGYWKEKTEEKTKEAEVEKEESDIMDLLLNDELDMMDLLLNEFNKQYEYLYENKIQDNVSVYEYDYRIRKDYAFRVLVKMFIDARKDFLTSDREVSAFVLALEKVGK